MEGKITERKDEINRKLTREGSWINAIFSEYNLDAKERQHILRSVINDIKIEERKEKKMRP